MGPIWEWKCSKTIPGCSNCNLTQICFIFIMVNVGLYWKLWGECQLEADNDKQVMISS